MTGIAAVYAAATFVSTLLGGLFALRFSSWMDRIMAFSGGVLLAAGLLDLLPDAIDLSSGSSRGSITASAAYTPLLCAVIGFVVFYLLERMAILRSYHTHHHHPEAASAGDFEPDPGRRQVGILGAAGLCVHSLLDGFSIGVAFHASHVVGLLVALAVITHDFSDGVSTVTLILSSRLPRRASLFWLLVDAAAPLAGVGISAAFSLSPHHLSWLLGAFAGMFLYLGATHMLPEAHALSDSAGTVLWMLAGVFLVILATHLLA